MSAIMKIWMVSVGVFFIVTEIFEIIAEHADGNETSLLVRGIGASVLLCGFIVFWFLGRRAQRRFEAIAKKAAKCARCAEIGSVSDLMPGADVCGFHWRKKIEDRVGVVEAAVLRLVADPAIEEARR